MKHTYIISTAVSKVTSVFSGGEQQVVCTYNTTLTAVVSGRNVNSVPGVWSLVSAVGSSGNIVEPVIFTPNMTTRVVMITLPANGDYLFRYTVYPDDPGRMQFSEVSVVTTPTSRLRNITSHSSVAVALSNAQAVLSDVGFSSPQGRYLGGNMDHVLEWTYIGDSQVDKYESTIQVLQNNIWTDLATYKNRYSFWVGVFPVPTFNAYGKSLRVKTIFYAQGSSIPTSTNFSKAIIINSGLNYSPFSALQGLSARIGETRDTFSYVVLPNKVVVDDPVSYLNLGGAFSSMGTTVISPYDIIPNKIEITDPSSSLNTGNAFVGGYYSFTRSVGTIPGGIIIGN